MKNMHFCTPELLKKLYSDETKYIITYRTGWIPQIFKDDIINLNHRVNNNKDMFVCKGIIVHNRPIQFKNIPDNKFSQEEIKRYGRKFHPEQWFFKIVIKITHTQKLYKLEKLFL